MSKGFLLLLIVATLSAQHHEGPTAANDPAAMAAAAEAARREMGGQVISFVQADRLEYQTNGNSGRFLWEGQAWIGTDFNRLWIKTEGERVNEGGKTEDAEIQALYSRPISSYFDVQAGVRQDFTPGQRRTFGVIGVQGLAPYWFEIDTALFISHEGDLSARFETEYDLRFTQRLILQPRVEANIAFQDVPRLSVDRGLAAFEGGARLRYEFRREVAPYIGVSWEYVAGEPNRLSFVTGLRLWF
ncbi:MAG: copper resistance protein B [Acidobacteria bacterium]|nr:copper resistance protein B [Acidobacteriota bacterium]MDA1234000.1 copper resistance protein B [Acidobacteriota bacterium]